MSKLNRKPLTWVREGSCIRCTSHALHHGYPRMLRNRKPQTIARLILIKRVGNIPSSVVSRHTCDNKWCIRPDHIISGTNADNMRDRKERGGYLGQSGENNHWSKLTSLQILQIRESEDSNREIAKRFDITRQHAATIRRLQTWRHI